MISKTSTLTNEKLYDLYWNDNLNQKDIGDMFDTTPGYIGRLMKKYGIPVRTREELYKNKESIKSTLSKKLLERLHYTEGKTTKEIAELFNTSPSYIRILMKNHNLRVILPNGKIKPELTLCKIITKDLLNDLYLDKKLSQNQIATLYNTTHGYIQRLLKRYGIKTRSKKEGLELILRNKITIPKEKLEHLYSDKELSQLQIANISGISQSKVSSLMKIYEIPTRKKNKLNTSINKENLYELYWLQNMSQERISELYKVSPSTIEKYMKKYEIPVRSAKDNCEIRFSNKGKNITKVILYTLYYEQNLTKQQISKKFDICAKSLDKLFKKYSIESKLEKKKESFNVLDAELTKDKLEKLYLTDLLSIDKIAEMYNTSHWTISKLKKKYGIPTITIKKRAIKNNSASSILDKNTLEYLYCNQRMTQKEIGEFYKVSGQYISQLMQEYNIPAHSKDKLGIAYSDMYATININFFLEDSPELAYIGGLMATDGHKYSTGSGNRFSLAMTDYDVIEWVMKTIGYKNSTYNHISGNLIVHRIAFSNYQVREVLEKKFNIISKKSLTLKFPKLIYWERPHFIRGVFDGDGGVIYSAKRNSLSIVISSASLHFISGVKRLINSLLSADIKLIKSKTKKGNTYYQYIFSRIERIKKFYHWIYSDGSFGCSRKKNKLKDSMNTYIRRKVERKRFKNKTIANLYNTIMICKYKNEDFEVIIDNEDLCKLEKNGGTWYVTRRNNRLDVQQHNHSGSNKAFLLLKQFLLNSAPGQTIIHINGNKLDFRKENLKLL